MFKILSLIFFLLWNVSVLKAANEFPTHINNLTLPHVIAERPGMYKFILSAEIAACVLDELRTLGNDAAENFGRTSSEEFEGLLHYFIYPHPSTLNGVKTLWKDFSCTIREIREILGIGEQLPFFLLSEYEKSRTLDGAIALFQRHIDSALSGLETKPDPEIVAEILLSLLPRIKSQAQNLLMKYSTFYDSRKSPFRKLDIELYINALLGIKSTTPITEKNLVILDILKRNGCLTLETPIIGSVFTYSPKAMVETYIARNGIPATIVLGCGHADSRDMLEALGLKAETWCGACDKLPHAGAMVISLDESSADILCDLNHPDLWAPLSNRSVTAIHDETYCLSCYSPTTLDQIARVLKIDGKFHSKGDNEGLLIKADLIVRGFDVVKEDIAARAIILRKAR